MSIVFHTLVMKSRLGDGHLFGPSEKLCMSGFRFWAFVYVDGFVTNRLLLLLLPLSWVRAQHWRLE